MEVGYTPGYLGAYEDDGTVVYGTGWDYEPWYGDDYYGWGWTWGYSYLYVPWYQWWVWRPWWNQPGGLRAALIENIYDRWQGRNGITHYDRPANAAARALRRLQDSPATRRCTDDSSGSHASGRAVAAAEHARAESLLPSANVRASRRDSARRPIAHHRPAVSGRRTRSLRVAGRKRLSPQERRLVSPSGGRRLELTSRRRKARSNAANWRPRAGRSPAGGGNVYRPTAGRDSASARSQGLGNGCRTPASRRAHRRSRPSNASTMRARWARCGRRTGARPTPAPDPREAPVRRR